MVLVAKNTRIVLGSANLVCAAATVLQNGTVALNAPAKSEDAQYPMSNLLVNDRYSIWRAANALTGTFNVDFDLGGDQNVDVVGMHGTRRAAGKTGPSTFDVQYRTAAQTYDGTGSWTSAKTGLSFAPTATPRDSVVQLPGVIRARYWRFAIGVGSLGGGFSLGNLVLAATSCDLGALYGPGAINELQLNRSEELTGARIPVLNANGDNVYAAVVPFQDADGSIKDMLRAVAEDSVSIFTMLDPFDVARQWYIPGGRQRNSHEWDELWNTGLEVQSCP